MKERERDAHCASPQDRRSWLLLIALIDLTSASNATPGEIQSRVLLCLSFIDAAGSGAAAGVRRPA